MPTKAQTMAKVKVAHTAEDAMVGAPPVEAAPAELADPLQVFTLPPELEARIEQQRARLQPKVEQIPVEFDTMPIEQAAAPEIVMGPSGPMVVRKRQTKSKLYRADGRVAEVPTVAVPKYLGKRKNGQRVFFAQPPVEMPKPTKLCPYCFKKFRPSTALELSANAAKDVSNDPEVQALLAQMRGEGDLDINDVEFKLAEHIRVKHGRLAAFRGDALYQKAKEAQERQRG